MREHRSNVERECQRAAWAGAGREGIKERRSTFLNFRRQGRSRPAGQRRCSVETSVRTEVLSWQHTVLPTSRSPFLLTRVAAGASDVVPHPSLPGQGGERTHGRALGQHPPPSKGTWNVW